jgi:hypothetical protein
VEEDLLVNPAHRDDEARRSSLLLVEAEVDELLGVRAGPVAAGSDYLLGDPRPGEEGLHVVSCQTPLF